MATEGCDCSKPKPLGKPTPPTGALTASLSGPNGIFHVASNGIRTQYSDLLGARAAVIRQGGSIETGAS